MLGSILFWFVGSESTVCSSVIDIFHSEEKLGSQRMNHGPDSSTTAWSSQVWFLRLVYNRNACDSREAEFNRKPVKVTIQTLRLFAHPFLTSLLLKLASGVFFSPDMGFASMDKNGTQQKSVNMCRKSVFVTKFTNGRSSRQM